MNNDTTHAYDVIIVGAGVVGAACACALGGSTLRVALITGTTPTVKKTTSTAAVDRFATRVSALNPASQQFLQQLDVWPRIARVSPYRHIHVWDAEGTGCIDFDAADVDRSVLGHIVENPLTLAALFERCKEHANIDIIDSAVVTTITDTTAGRMVTLDNGHCFTAPLIIAADGAASNIRQQLGFDTREWRYGHSAIVATVRTTLPHQETARQRFMSTGPLAFLPLMDDTNDQQLCSIVWSVITPRAEQLMALNDNDFCTALTEAFEHRLGAITDIGTRASFVLRQCHARDYILPGVALVGDAAHHIHPLAGQGLNLGLQDVNVLTEELMRAEQRDLLYSDIDVLKRYQRRRKADNLTMMATVEGFKRLFASRALPVRWLRNTGMRWLNQQPLLKQPIIRHAMGV